MMIPHNPGGRGVDIVEKADLIHPENEPMNPRDDPPEVGGEKLDALSLGGNGSDQVKTDPEKGPIEEKETEKMPLRIRGATKSSKFTQGLRRPSQWRIKV